MANGSGDPFRITTTAPRMWMRIPVLRRWLRKSRAQRVAEIGPGLGDLASLVLRDGATGLTLFETSPDAAALLRERFAACPVEVVEGPVEAGSSTFDAVIACEVLEHVEADVELLSDIAGALDTNGILVGSVPAFMRKWQAVDDYAGHLRRYEFDELHDKLEQAGFSDIEIRNYGFPLTSLLHPLRELYYRRRNEGERLPVEEATARSGIDRPKTPGWMVSLVRLLTTCLLPLQALSRSSQLGDGFVFRARRKRDA